jgi:RNA polymerase sigma-70 factor (ECF subfamily)
VTEIEEFKELIRRVRAGDEEAACTFVQTYEPAIRRAARIRILDPRLTPLLDSTDIVQSVFASFFVRAALGQYDLEKPEHVLRLLVSMSKKKLADYARKQAAARRDYRRTLPTDQGRKLAVAVDCDPARNVANAELVDEFRRRLSPEERELAELRAQGQNWDDIGQTRGESPEALRKRLERAVTRISQDLGLDEGANA